jgi:ferritin-like metal-binding protein YciE
MKNKDTNTQHTPSQSINNSQKKIKERNRRCMLKEEHEVRQAIIDGATENREKTIREAEEVLHTGAKPPKKRKNTTLQRMQEPANRLVQNTDPQEHVAAALVSGMMLTACLQLPVATAMPGRTQEDVSTSTIRLMPTA